MHTGEGQDMNAGIHHSAAAASEPKVTHRMPVAPGTVTISGKPAREADLLVHADLFEIQDHCPGRGAPTPNRTKWG